MGAFAPAMDHLKKSGMLEALQEKFQSGTPMLGVCVGAQLLMDNSEEDDHGLGWIQGKVKRFSHELKIPQIGWNSVTKQKNNLLFNMFLMKCTFTLCTLITWNLKTVIRS